MNRWSEEETQRRRAERVQRSGRPYLIQTCIMQRLNRTMATYYTIWYADGSTGGIAYPTKQQAETAAERSIQ